jgi:hypothetical protein
MRAWCVAGEDLKEVVSGQWVAWKQLGDNAAAPPFTPPPPMHSYADTLSLMHCTGYCTSSTMGSAYRATGSSSTNNSMSDHNDLTHNL